MDEAPFYHNLAPIREWTQWTTVKLLIVQVREREQYWQQSQPHFSGTFKDTYKETVTSSTLDRGRTNSFLL